MEAQEYTLSVLLEVREPYFEGLGDPRSGRVEEACYEADP